MICITKVLLVEVSRVHGCLVGDLLAVGHAFLGALLVPCSLVHLQVEPRQGDLGGNLIGGQGHFLGQILIKFLEA